MDLNHSKKPLVIQLQAILATSLCGGLLLSAQHAVAEPAQSGAPVLSISESHIGRDGANAVIPFLIWGSTPAQAGGDGQTVKIAHDGLLGVPYALSQVELSSIGGKGGDGDVWHPAMSGGQAGDITFRNNAEIWLQSMATIALKSAGGHGGTGNRSAQGGAGGNAGRIEFINDKMISRSGGAGDLITASSIGGNGGAVLLNDSKPVSAGTAGAGAEVLFINNDTVSSSQTGGSLVALLSKGGTSGTPAIYKLPPNGGEGGAVTAQINADILLTDSGRANTLLSARSEGGASGDHPGYGTIQSILKPDGLTRGGNGGAVTVTIAADTRIAALNSVAPSGSDGSAQPQTIVLAESQGGQGGNGSGGGSFFEILNPSHAVPGGAGGTVAVTIEGEVVSTQNNGNAVTARSMGGDGGVGGWGNGFFNKIGTGNGGNGGNGKQASVNVGSTGAVKTAGDHAVAVIVESVAGNGGNGGEAKSTAVTGGWGGKGGAFTDSAAQPSVRFINEGSIHTHGTGSTAVALQSIGGLGGDGGKDGGAQAGEGGAAGYVSGTNEGVIKTEGEHAVGLFGQSVGGTGGKGSDGNLLNIGGGAGGQAGRGGAISLLNAGLIETRGDHSAAVAGQSVGGGGAVAAFAGLANASEQRSASATGGKAGSFFAARGGRGGSGGHAGEVTLTNEGFLQTYGASSYGLFGQSIGGSGATGGEANSKGLLLSVAVGGDGGGGGNGGAVTLARGVRQGSIVTEGTESPAVFLQSIGGGGGTGGGAIAHSLGPIFSTSIAIGGNGGAGGKGGKVTANNTSHLYTRSADSDGILALSVGGGGGHAGSATSYSTAVGFAALPDISISSAIGGSGGKGGEGGAVTVTNERSITTEGSQSRGIKALSVGGGGGDGSSATSVANMIGSNISIGASTAVGGSGGKGGSGGAVTVNNQGEIATGGAFADALVASSIGGGGGSGGTGSAAAITGFTMGNAVVDGANTVSKLFVSMANSISATYEAGGSGGVAGAGRAVQVTNQSRIGTSGANAGGIIAQSIGGGGGIAGGYVGGGNEDLGAAVSIGGKGGAAGEGGAVAVGNLAGASIMTAAGGSHGIYAQSVGGGGGIGGGLSSSLNGTQDNAWNSALEVIDKLEQVDELSNAAGQLIGLIKAKADGGALGHAFAALMDRINKPGVADKLRNEGIFAPLKSLSEAQAKLNADVKANMVDGIPSLGINVGLGGNGGASGKGGKVTVDNAGAIWTQGETSIGIFAQSVGGGGGSGGAASTVPGNLVNAGMSVGGKGKSGGTGGAVTVTNTGSVETAGDSAFGILATSVGGGGGLAGVATNGETIGFTAAVGLGGSGGASGNGGEVKVTNAGTVSTAGDEAHAVVAQSVGGGGGIAVVHHASIDQRDNFIAGQSPELKKTLEGVANLLNKLEVGLTESPTELIEAGEDGSFLDYVKVPAFTATFGGAGGAGGDGGEVWITQSGAAITTGEAAFGLFAQSIGGGGGFGSSGGVQNGYQAGIGLGGKGGAAGKGGAVTVILSDEAQVRTEGEGAIGAFLQSIGGGGGYSGSHSLHALAQTGVKPYEISRAEGGTAGNGGKITLTSAQGSIIHTSGKDAHGIFAQSIGGGGGAFGPGGAADSDGSGVSRSNALGQGGAINLRIDGLVIAEGADAHGIWAQSGVQKTDGTIDASRYGGAINVVVGGTVQGGSGTASGIHVDSGSGSNVVRVLEGGTVSALSGIAISGGASNERVLNMGTVIGNLDLGAGSNKFDNLGVFNMGPSVVLGDSGRLFNESILNVGAARQPATVSLSGNFGQHHKGVLGVYADFAKGEASRLDISGTARLDGSLRTYALSLAENVAPMTVLQAGDITGSLSAIDTVAVDYELSAPTTYTRALSIASVDFTGRGASMTDNHMQMARHFQSIWESGDPEFTATFGELANPETIEEYEELLDRYTGEGFSVMPALTPVQVQTKTNAMMSCPVFEGHSSILTEESCFWARTQVSNTRHFDEGAVSGYDEHATSFRIGGQLQVAQNWFIGGFASTSESKLRSNDGRFSLDGDGYDLGAVVKRRAGHWLFSLGFTHGHSDQDVRRYIDVAGERLVAYSKPGTDYYATRLRAAYQFDFDGWYLRPMMDVDVVRLHTPAYSERGAGAYGFAIDDDRASNTLLTPAVEVGARFDVADLGVVRPYASLGLSMARHKHWETSGRLLGADESVPDFTQRYSLPDRTARLNMGVDLVRKDRIELKAEFELEAAEEAVRQAGSLRLGYRF